MIQLKNVTKIYGRGRDAVKALNGVSIDFGSRGLVVILGKSGCGKSTLLNIMGGLDKPSSGELIVDGRSARTFSESNYDSYRNTYVGMVFQEFNLIDEVTVYQNIEITLKLQERNTDVNTVDEALKIVGLSNLGYRKPSELSGGQRQRVSLARALLKNPRILLADEPTGALDASTSEEVFDVLKKLSEKQLIVVVTHDRELAFTYGERIIELTDGRVVSDKIKETDGNSSVKELSGNVLEVAAGGRVEPCDLNAKLKPGEYNFIGISHDKERIALAYPETFDSFYLPRERIKMRDTDAADVVSDGAAFKLRRSALGFKDALKMARVNRKRAKKRFWFIAALNMLCFTMFALSVMLSQITLPNVIAKSAFDGYSQGMLAVTKLRERYWGNPEPEELSDGNISDIRGVLGGRDSYKLYDVSLYPFYCNADQAQTNVGEILNVFGGINRSMDLTLNVYSGVIEGANLSDLGLKTVRNGGADKCAGTDEIIISDFAAEKLVQRGFIGYDGEGHYGVQYPVSAEEVVGMSVLIVNLDAYFKIAGVFGTDYKRYDYLHRAEERLSQSSGVNITNWQNNKDFLYSRIFVKEGFIGEYFADGGGDMYTLGAETGYFNGTDYIRSFTNVNFNLKNIAYSNSKFYNPKDGGAPFLWVAPDMRTNVAVPGGGTEVFPYLNREYDYSSCAALDIRFFTALFPEVSGIEDMLWPGTDKIDDRFIDNIRFTLGGKQNLWFRICAIYDGRNFDGLEMLYANTAAVSEIVNAAAMGGKAVQLKSLMLRRDGGRKQTERLADALLKQKFLLYSSVGSVQDLLQIRDMFDTAAAVFLYVSLGIAIFSFLLMLNYMSSSVRFRAKEIAVYRVVGASRLDVAKIFMTENLTLILVTTIMTFILTWITSYFLKLAFKASMQIFNLSFSVFSFGPLPMLAVFGAIAALVFAASLIPVIGITRRKAIDALKVIG